jgi:mRNA-degrading endonuclease HigB of HigAB toxin-antitoxin module
MQFNGTYEQRINNNFGEVRFIAFCNTNGWVFRKLGFDNEKDIKNIWKLNPIITKMPDFIIEKNDKTYVIEVKGTKSFKKKDYDMIDKLIYAYDSEEAPLIYAFCLFGNKTIFKTPQEVKELFEQGTDNQWEDKVVFRELNI